MFTTDERAVQLRGVALGFRGCLPEWKPPQEEQGVCVCARVVAFIEGQHNLARKEAESRVEIGQAWLVPQWVDSQKNQRSP